MAAGDDPFTEDQAEILASRAKQAEAGVGPYQLKAWSIDTSRKGLAVRAAHAGLLVQAHHRMRIPPSDDAADPSDNLPIDGTLERLYA